MLERAGDLVVARVRLPDVHGPGAWPALWSWRDGGNEVDLFEWHSDRPHTLEFVNHTRRPAAFTSWTSPQVAPGAWLYTAVLLGARNTTWYVGTSLRRLRPAWSDHCGVGRAFRAYPVLNLSIDDGSIHPPPTTTGPITFQIGSLALYRSTR
ncbi:hypothetical protein [Streptacidiphilus sp. PAMC 29251]